MEKEVITLLPFHPSNAITNPEKNTKLFGEKEKTIFNTLSTLGYLLAMTRQEEATLGK